MKILDTCLAAIKVKIAESRSEHMTHLTGTLLFSDTLEPVPGIIRRRHQFDPKKRHKADEIDKVVNRLVCDYKELVSCAVIKKNKDNDLGVSKGIFTSTFELYDDNKHTYFSQPNRWKQSTLEKTIASFKVVLKEMDKYGLEITQSDVDNIRTTLEQKALDNRRSNNDINQAVYNKAMMLKRIDCLLGMLYELNPDLPKLYFDAKATLKTPKAEAFKAIPQPVRFKMILEIINNIDNGLYLGIAVMLLAGPRTAEAAALSIGDIEIINGSFAVFPIRVQLNQNKEIDEMLKYEASYRVAIAPYLFVRIYQLRVKHLICQGYDYETILTFPLVSDPFDPAKYCSPNALSALGKELLISSGLTEDEYSYYRALSITQPDMLPGNLKNSNVTNYICRRDFASRAENDCGLTPVETDYLLGHKNPKTRDYDFTNLDTQSAIAKKLERAILHTKYTLNPYFNIFIPADNRTVDFDGYSAYKIASGDEANRVQLSQLSSCEPGQKIIIRTNGAVIKAGKMVRGTIAIKNKKNPNPPIGTIVRGDKM